VALVGERRGDRNVHFSGALRALAMTACDIGRVARKSSTLFGRATSEYAVGAECCRPGAWSRP
jgi:hypothetical protein